MSAKIKTIYTILGIIILLLIILFLILKIFNLELKLNTGFFTYNQSACEKKFEELDREYLRITGEMPGEHVCARPALFKVK